jgi:2-aminoethylphosphonate transport system substrate-binding protein
MYRLFVTLFLSMTGIAPAFAGPETVTVYSAGGLHDGQGSWLEKQFAAFSKTTGVDVQYVEAGAGAILDRALKDKARADVLITLPPFIQKAEADSMLQPYRPDAALEIDGGDALCQPLANNYLSFIYNAAALTAAPATFSDILDPRYKQKLQYSTPGQAGDGTALMLQVFHVFGDKAAGFDYLRRLQVNNVGPSPATGRLTPLVNDATLYVANGDLQMNLAQLAANKNIRIFWPAGPNGERSTISMSYYIGLLSEAPHAENAKKLIEFLLSKEAQSVIVGEPVRKDVQRTDPDYMKLRQAMQGVTIWAPDWTKVLKELPVDVAKWHEITGS